VNTFLVIKSVRKEYTLSEDRVITQLPKWKQACTSFDREASRRERL